MKLAQKFIRHKVAALVLGTYSPPKNKCRVDALAELLGICPEIQKVVFTGGGDQARHMRSYFQARFPHLCTPRRVFTEEFATNLDEQIENTQPLFVPDTQIVLLAGTEEIKTASENLRDSGLITHPFFVL
jgi:hypothetical protein